MYFEFRDISSQTVPIVRDIDEDRLGNIWAATPGGLIRYDGKTPELWDRNDIPGLPSERVECLAFEHSSDALWIGTDAGVILYDFSTGQSESVILESSVGQILRPQVLDITISTDNRVFILTDAGIFTMTGDNGFIRVPVVRSDGSEGAVLSDLAAGPDGGIWAVSSDGLKKWDPAESRFSHELYVPGAAVVEIIGEGIWIGAEPDTIYCYQPEAGNVKYYAAPDSISSFAADSSGRIWVSSFDNGLGMIDPDKGYFQDCPTDAEHPYMLSSRRVDCLYSSGSRMWVGTVDSGLYSLNLDKTNNLTYIQRSGSRSLPIGPVSVISEDSLGYLWTGSHIGGLARIDPVSREIKPYLSNENDFFSIQSDCITSILEDSTGGIWIGTDKGPAFYISEIEGFEPPGAMFGGWPDLSGSRVHALTEGGDGSIWMSLGSGSVYKMDVLERDFNHYPDFAGAAPQVLHTDRFGSVWTGSRSEIRLFNKDGGQAASWNLLEDIGLEELADGISAIYSDSRDRIWLGGPGGTAVYDPSTEVFAPIESLDGRRFSVSGIVEDRDGNMWIADEKVIHIFNAEGGHLGMVDSGSGFNPAGFISGITRTQQGSILIGANGEIWTFDNLPGNHGKIIPDVHIRSVRIAGKEPMSDFNSDGENSIRISHKENSLMVDFGVVNFETDDRIRFEHRLIGHDDTWYDSDDSRLINYVNLPFRDLVLEVRAYDAETGEKGRVMNLNIEVTRPGWRQWWAIVLYSLGIAAVAGVIDKLREGSLLKGQVDALEEARNEVLKVNQKLEIMTMNDTLSGLLNRRGFDRAVEQALSIASRGGQMISLFMLDVDFFKRYNDNYGHLAGDEVLRGVGRALKSVFGRSTDIIARYGGEEFAVVFIGENPDALVLLANELLTAIHNLDIPHDFSEADSRLTLSAGSATIRVTKELTATELISLSDKALYVAKDAGRKRVCFAGIVPQLPQQMINGTTPIILETGPTDE